MKRYALLVALLLFTLISSVASANSSLQEGGQEYIVRSGDTLSYIAGRLLDDRTAWRAIWEATNAKAESDSTFAMISNPNFIRVGQKLWIPGPGGSSEGMSDEALLQAYQAAVRDAQIVEPHEISKDLVAIVPFNNNLVWEGTPGASRVLGVTWTSWDGYDDKVGGSMGLEREVWVTSAPQVKTFCSTYQAGEVDLTLRLEQLLGLPPHNGKTKFVEMWVEPKDLFRPSPDPEISDQEAELSFPQSSAFTVNEEHVQWINNLTASSYGEGGYPWTRLGYTYDWGNPESEVGMSEFVVAGGATIGVHSVMATEVYCGR